MTTTAPDPAAPARTAPARTRARTPDRHSRRRRTPARRAQLRRPRVPSVLLKFVMATSGALMLLYLVVHMIGNLRVFAGPAAIDGWAVWLREVGQPVLPYEGMVWIVRVVLTVAILAHVWSATVLTIRARRARPVRYVAGNHAKGSYAARTMRWGGVIVALFVVYHILDLTTGTLNPNGEHLRVHANLAADFTPDRWYVTLFYVLAVLAVGLHVRHGLWSGLQTLGASNARRERPIKIFSTAVAVLLTAGFLAVPIAVTFGVV